MCGVSACVWGGEYGSDPRQGAGGASLKTKAAIAGGVLRSRSCNEVQVVYMGGLQGGGQPITVHY